MFSNVQLFLIQPYIYSSILLLIVHKLFNCSITIGYCYNWNPKNLLIQPHVNTTFMYKKPYLIIYGKFPNIVQFIENYSNAPLHRLQIGKSTLDLEFGCTRLHIDIQRVHAIPECSRRIVFFRARLLLREMKMTVICRARSQSKGW